MKRSAVDFMKSKGFVFNEIREGTFVFFSFEHKVICIVYKGECFELVYTNENITGFFTSGVIENMYEDGIFDTVLNDYLETVDLIKENTGDI